MTDYREAFERERESHARTRARLDGLVADLVTHMEFHAHEMQRFGRLADQMEEQAGDTVPEVREAVALAREANHHARELAVLDRMVRMVRAEATDSTEPEAGAEGR